MDEGNAVHIIDKLDVNSELVESISEQLFVLQLVDSSIDISSISVESYVAGQTRVLQDVLVSLEEIKTLIDRKQDDVI